MHIFAAADLPSIECQPTDIIINASSSSSGSNGSPTTTTAKTTVDPYQSAADAERQSPGNQAKATGDQNVDANTERIRKRGGVRGHV